MIEVKASKKREKCMDSADHIEISPNFSKDMHVHPKKMHIFVNFGFSSIDLCIIYLAYLQNVE
jgi:hypothetical protein